MSKFKPRPALPDMPDPDAVARFAAGAEHRAIAPLASVPAAELAPVVIAAAPPPVVAATKPDTPPAPIALEAARDESPWLKHDKAAKPISGINLRLNDYEHELLRYLADVDSRSIQQTIKRLLLPAAEAAVRKLRRGA